ncbi:(S)-3,5-dihydroxyphenylglycine transaminase [Micromonospora pattaloongensis]|uniref:(S)-3,5-dihydroxyphenylglycine transaminase n=1 Tax=Micromonospora pattaloongensis TaxID=405436 RepID=A0A1H3JTG9_9ACTN|nr:hypothetical protein [Micromonospora pattaloongensis]SDY43213.1 (S)-3,5-dihydroxyphenylglycine transaminase [Micromonospora pattaloongensis]
MADEAALARAARDHGIIFTPLSSFDSTDGGAHEIRLSFRSPSIDEIVEGIGQLARFVEDTMRNRIRGADR